MTAPVSRSSATLAPAVDACRTVIPDEMLAQVLSDPRQNRRPSRPGGEQYQFVESYRWIPSFGTGYILGIDGIALSLVVLTAVLVPLLLAFFYGNLEQ